MAQRYMVPKIVTEIYKHRKLIWRGEALHSGSFSFSFFFCLLQKYCEHSNLWQFRNITIEGYFPLLSICRSNYFRGWCDCLLLMSQVASVTDWPECLFISFTVLQAVFILSYTLFLIALPYYCAIKMFNFVIDLLIECSALNKIITKLDHERTFF